MNLAQDILWKALGLLEGYSSRLRLNPDYRKKRERARGSGAARVFNN